MATAAARRRKHHRVDEFPPEVQDQVRKRLADGETYESVTRWLVSQGLFIGRSSVARYGRDWLAGIEAAAVTRDYLRALIQETGLDPLEMEKGGTKLALHMIVEALMKLQTLGAKQKDGVQLIKAMAQIVRSSAQVESVSIGVRDEQRKKAETAAQEIGDEARQAGLSEDQVKRIQEQVLGIAG